MFGARVEQNLVSFIPTGCVGTRSLVVTHGDQFQDAAGGEGDGEDLVFAIPIMAAVAAADDPGIAGTGGRVRGGVTFCDYVGSKGPYQDSTLARNV